MKGKLIASLGVFDLLIDNQIYAQLPGSPLISLYQKLSLKNCKAIRDGYDLDELAELELKKETAGFFFYQSIGFMKGFNEGFQKAIEILGDKKFTEEKMKQFAEYVWKEVRSGRMKSMDELFNDWVAPKQTEWDVEVVMEEMNLDEIREQGKGFLNATTKKAKLDSNGCIILKRI